jgi:hypothetical protein
MDPGGGFPREVVALIAALGAAVMCCGHCLWRDGSPGVAVLHPQAREEEISVLYFLGTTYSVNNSR